MSPDGGGSPDELDFEVFADEFTDGSSPWWGHPWQTVVYAPGSNINTGEVHGDQHVETTGAVPGGTRPVEAQDGPISPLEILAARTGFATPDCFPEALERLRTRLLFLVGEPGTGRRTTALNLLFECSGHSTVLRALDSDSDLSVWGPTQREARGYLVHGLAPEVRLGPAAIARLRRRLDDADAYMVVMLPHDADRLRALARDLEITPVRYLSPTPRAVFDACLEAAVLDGARRRALLDRLGPDLDGLLAPGLVPAQVAELVAAVSGAGDEGPDPADLGERLSFLAETEAPDLLHALRKDPDGLAFLLVTSVLEGFDRRIVREEADRLLRLADGRLDALLPVSVDEHGDHRRSVRSEAPRENPRFAFRRSLDALLATVRAECLPSETRRTWGYSYTVEPVRFRRHRQAESVLRHVWRQYRDVSVLLTEWMNVVAETEPELAEPVGHVVGLAAGWTGGRRAIRHIYDLARSDRAHCRSTAAYALGVAAQDPILAGEVKHHLRSWSRRGGWRLRSTVAEACGGDFGVSRPEPALRLLRHCYRGEEGKESTVSGAVRGGLQRLFVGGNQPAVLGELLEWADQPGGHATLSLDVFAGLLLVPTWFQQQLGGDGEFAEAVITLVRRTLNDDRTFDHASLALVDWCHQAIRDEPLRAAVETLLTALARDMRSGELRLLVEIDGDDTPDLVGRDIAHTALEAWRRGEPGPYRAARSFGGFDDQ
ncbi:hypothetical protein ACIRD3_04505 [Kitasatospora sp. NPDC093550]|uniref:hypothetical protein n=1 Tax=Kitasatospora sp. NPDC093550 TaxID=3364089 RepID=UPI003814D09D